jgi:hypothetical protein
LQERHAGSNAFEAPANARAFDFLCDNFCDGHGAMTGKLIMQQ